MRFNKQGRATSDSMRLKAFMASCPRMKDKTRRVEYRGFIIERGMRGPNWFVEHDPRVFTALDKAKHAIDTCLESREMLEIHK